MSVLAQVDFDQGIEDAWSTVATFVPKFLAFLAVLLIGWFIARLLAKALDAVLERVGFDRWVERGVVQRALENSKYDASDFVSKLVFYGLMLFVLQLAFGIWGPNPVSGLIEGAIAYLPKVLAAVLIIVVAAAIAAAVKDILESALGGLTYGRSLATIASVAIIALGAFAALDQLEIAPDIVQGLFYAVLAIVAGSAIVAIGGGGIGPMRRQWEKAMERVEAEAPRVRAAAEQASEQRAQELRAEATTTRPDRPLRATSTVPSGAAPGSAEETLPGGPGPVPRQDDWTEYQS
ncbi:MAG: mechanosensitive ion channel family protein [Acidimicrobiales bacterium]